MTIGRRKSSLCSTLAIAMLALSGIAVAVVLAVGPAKSLAWWQDRSGQALAAKPPVAVAELVADEPHTLRLPPDVVSRLGIQADEVRKAAQPRALTLVGSLALDANRLARVHSRFAGEVAEIGTGPVWPADGPNAGRTTFRQLQMGDRIEKDQLLAVVWCKDLGEKKSELVDALSQLRLDRERLEKLEEGYRRQAIPEASVRQSRRDVEADVNAVARAERTLRVWRLSDAEIAEVKAEAERISQRQGQRDKDKENRWARVEVRAPFDSVVLERNLAMGDIVDTTADLFKIADLSQLSVWAYVYENHLPALLKLPQPIPWSVRLKSDPDAPPVSGRIDLIGNLVDPTQHTVLVRGSVENPGERLRRPIHHGDDPVATAGRRDGHSDRGTGGRRPGERRLRPAAPRRTALQPAAGQGRAPHRGPSLPVCPVTAPRETPGTPVPGTG